MDIISWNVNGIRAVLNKGFLDFLHTEKPDILCLQEVKALREQVTFPDLGPYQIYWHAAEKKGYSGTAVLSKAPILENRLGLGHGSPIADTEGRVLTVRNEDFALVNVYVPNAQPELTRLTFKSATWWPAFLQYIKELRKQGPVIVCGDLNVAHSALDLARPKENEGSAGFTREERGGMDQLLALGMVDVFREQHRDQSQHYTWWSYRAGARQRNVGWRIDYVLVDERLLARVKNADILPHVMGSDHCPVRLRLL